MRIKLAALSSGGVASVLPVCAAASKVALDQGFEAGDLIPFGIWSAMFGMVMIGVGWLLVEITLDVHQRWPYLAASIVAPLIAVLFTMFVALVLGPWIGGFGFPILGFWVLGGVVGLCLAVHWTRDVRA
jgi:hypothetical protein